MKLVLKRFVISTLVIMILMLQIGVNAFAAGTVTVTASKQSVNISDTLKISVTFKADEEMAVLSGYFQYDSSVLELQSVSCDKEEISTGLIKFTDSMAEDTPKERTVELKLKAKKVGQSTLRVYNCKYQNPLPITLNEQSITVNVADAASTTKSGNANLKSLYLSNNIPLTPAFNKDVTTYNVNIDNSITKVLVSAVAEDAGAKTSVQGSANMKEGANQRIVVVTAPNGTQKKYVININRATTDGTTLVVNPYDVTINGEKWILANEYPEGTILDRFVLSSTKVNSLEVPAIVNEVNGKVVLMAKNADGSVTKYFEYNSAAEEFKEYRMLNEASQNYVLIDLMPNAIIPKGYYKTTAVLGGHSVEVFKYESPDYADYLIFYAEYNSEIKDYFRYDSTTGSVQRSPEFNVDLAEAKILASSHFSSRLAALTVKERIFVGAVFVSGLLVLALVIIMIVKIAKTASQNRLARLDELDELDELEELEEYDYYEPQQDDFEILEETEEIEETEETEETEEE